MRSYEELKKLKNKSDDRILKLRAKAGGATRAAITSLDSRLFNGQNNLHVIRGITGLWMFKYDDGIVPGALKQSFTSADKAIDYAKRYFETRNVEIYEIVD